MWRKSITGLLLLLPILISAQVGTLKGSVQAEDSGHYLVGANVLIKGTNIGTSTGLDGFFLLPLPEEEVEIIISYIGYHSQEFKLETGQRRLYTKLAPGANTPGTPVTVYAPGPRVQPDIPAPVQMINNRELLERDQGLNITPALNRVTGVYMHSGALNTNRITIRGVGNRSPFATAKIRAYLDEIPLTTGVGETTIEDIDLSLLQQVQVWKGPTGSIYGAGLGGMISLQTSEMNRGDKGALSVSGSFGSYGLVRNVNQFKWVDGQQKLSVGLNINYTHSDGYRENNEYDRFSLAAIGKFKPNPYNEFTFFINHIDLKAFIPSSLNREDFENDPRKAAFTWGRVMGFEDYRKQLIGLSQESKVRVKGRTIGLKLTNSIFATSRDAYESRPFNILRENSQALGFRSLVKFDKGRGYSFNAGIEYFRELYDWQTYETDNGTLDTLLSDNQEVRKYYNLFVEATFEFAKRFEAVLGVNYNKTRYNYQDFFVRNGDNSGNFAFEGILSPRLGLRYEIKQGSMLFASVSHGFSPPTLEETLTPDGARNPEIRPERGWNFELGVRNSRAYGLSYDISVFSMQVRDLLVARRTADDQFIGINAGKTRHNGLEAFVHYRKDLGQMEISPFLGYTFSDFKFTEFIDDSNDYSGNELTGTAPHIVQAGVDLNFKFGLYGNVNFQFVDAMPMRDDNSVYSDAFTVFNTKLGYRRQLGRRFSLDLHAGINNFLDEKYASMILINAASFGGNAPRYYYPGLPRNYFGGISLKYIFNASGLN